MSLKSIVKKLEKQLNGDLSDDITTKCGIPVCFTHATYSDEVKESKKQQCIDDYIIKISKELNISVDRAKQEFDKNDVDIMSVVFV